MSGTTRTTPRPDPRRVRLGLAAFALVCGVFLVLELPPYLGYDPARSRVPLRTGYALHYPLLWAHIAFGTVALLAACLQLWPWLRRAHPRVHRWSGRVYLFGGVFPGGLVVLGVAPVSSTGFASAVGNTALAVLWLATGAAGWRAARAHRWADHRTWMLRNVALTFSIVVNRVWLAIYLVAVALLGPPGALDDPALVGTAAAASVWSSWVVNLLVVDWFVLRRRPRAATRTR